MPEGMMQAMMQLQNYVDQSGLDPQLLEMLCMRVSQINGCAYCLDMHYQEATHLGESILRLISLPAWRETSFYTPKERAALAFAELLTELPADQEGGDYLHGELSKYFSKQEIAYLTLAICHINSWNRLNKSFGAEGGHYKVGAKLAFAKV